MSTHGIAVILVNLGSPASPRTGDVRRFLREFLGDRRVVNLPRPLWWLILHLFILPWRPRRSAHAYRSIWTAEGSPLAVLTRQLAAQLQHRYGRADLCFDYAMRYGQPTLPDRLRTLQAQGIDRFVILPLYPQNSSTTTASVHDVLAATLNGWRHIPTLHFIADYHRHPGYIRAVADSIRRHWQTHGRAQLLLMSFHGLPARLTTLGDPYEPQCRDSARLIAAELGLTDEQWLLVFQSRFGKAEWLQPYCVETLQTLPGRGIRSVDVVCPGFAVDCLETLEEIAQTNRQVFLTAGGENYRYIEALNASGPHVELLSDLIAPFTDS